MLIRFAFGNFRSFKEPAEFSMVASADSSNPNNLIETDKGRLLRSVAIYGANASGKSNVIKAITAALIAIRTSSDRQVDAMIPNIVPYEFVEEKGETKFELEFVAEGVRYIYGFSCTANTITKEYLHAYNTQKPSCIFLRDGESYRFFNPETEKELKPLVKRNNPNKSFLATATAWGSALTKPAYMWLSSGIDTFDSRAIPIMFLDSYVDDPDGSLKAFTINLLKEADINIVDFTVEARDVEVPMILNVPLMQGVAIPQKQKEFRVFAKHVVPNTSGGSSAYELALPNESAGTQNLFFLAPQMKKALDNGSVFCIDELDSSLHPDLLLYIVRLFNSPETNPHGAQLIMTAHTTEILALSIMRRDQILFVQKDNDTGISELYSLHDFPVRTRDDIRSAYLAGKYGAVPNII